MSLDVGFAVPMNPNFDLKTLMEPPKPKTPATFPHIPLREMLVIQPPLGPGERLPVSLALREGEISASSQPLPHYIKVQQIGLYVPVRHIQILELVLAEMADRTFSTTHGTTNTFRTGCEGPLCRRAIREMRAETIELRRLRTGYRARTGIKRKDRYTQLKTSVPQYAAVEPLLFSFSVISHLINRPAKPSKEGALFLSLDTHAKLHAHLREAYAPDVNI